jgi:hypothetical protein
MFSSKIEELRSISITAKTLPSYHNYNTFFKPPYQETDPLLSLFYLNLTVGQRPNTGPDTPSHDDDANDGDNEECDDGDDDDDDEKDGDNDDDDDDEKDGDGDDDVVDGKI